jgi:hypothetical protein
MQSCRCAESATRTYQPMPNGSMSASSIIRASTANLDFVLLDTVRLVEQLRRKGRTVLIHCVQAQSRTPAVAALYGARLRGIGIAEAIAEVCGVLPNADPIPEFREALRRLHAVAHENADD